MNFRQFIRIKRIEKKRNLNKDAIDFGKSKSYLSIMESGRQPLSDDYRDFLCQMYDIDMEVLCSYLVAETTVKYYSTKGA